MIINELLKQLPQTPGVYMMIDSLQNIIYVGKAKNLKARVSQYFKNQKDRDPKVAEMIRNIHTCQFVAMDTELDALIEECRLIKDIKPRYNRLMKNDKRYSYIRIPTEQYPKVTIVNEKKDDNAIYFGPFTSIHRIENAVQYINDFYPIRKCPSSGIVKKANGCLNHQLGKCMGVCTGYVSPDEYHDQIKKIEQLLNGNNKTAITVLTKRLDEVVEKLEFEKAAQYRNYYLGIKHVIEKQRLIRSSSSNKCILAIEFMDSVHAKLFIIKGNKLLYREVLNMETLDPNELEQFLEQIIREKFYAEKNNTNILTKHDIDEAQIISSYLKKNKNSILSIRIPTARLNRKSPHLDTIVQKIMSKIRLPYHNSVNTSES